MKMTMTASDVVKELRKLGMHTDIRRVVDGIECGAYPFGRIVRSGPACKRRSVEIFTVDFWAWVASKTPQDTLYEAEETFKRRLAWAAANNPRAIDRLVANVADVVKNAAPDVAASGNGTKKMSTG